MSHEQLTALQGVLLGDTIPDDVSNLPDLSGMSSEQLVSLETRLRNLQSRGGHHVVDGQSDLRASLPENHEMLSQTGDSLPVEQVRQSRSRDGELQRTERSRSEAEVTAAPSRLLRQSTWRAQSREGTTSDAHLEAEPRHQNSHRADVAQAVHRHSHHRHRDLDAALALWMMGGAVSQGFGLGRLLSTPSVPHPGMHDSQQAGSQDGETSWKVTSDALTQLRVRGKDVPQNEECAICCLEMKGDDAAALPCLKKGCSSYFHLECIRPWLEKNPSCPLCRCDCKHLVESAVPEHRDSDWEAGDDFPLAAFLLNRSTSQPQLRQRGRDLEFTGQGRMSMQDMQEMMGMLPDRRHDHVSVSGTPAPLRPLQHQPRAAASGSQAVRLRAGARGEPTVGLRASVAGQFGGRREVARESSMPRLAAPAAPVAAVREQDLHDRRSALLEAYHQSPSQYSPHHHASNVHLLNLEEVRRPFRHEPGVRIVHVF